MKSTRRIPSRLGRLLSVTMLCAALTSCADVGPDDELDDAEETLGRADAEEAEPESVNAALESAEVAAAAATKSKTVYSGSGGSKVLAYYQKRSGKFYVIGIHVSDVKCDDKGAGGIAYRGGLGTKKQWFNDKGCKTDSYWTTNYEATGVCACDNEWYGCRDVKCVGLN